MCMVAENYARPPPQFNLHEYLIISPTLKALPTPLQALFTRRGLVSPTPIRQKEKSISPLIPDQPLVRFPTSSDWACPEA